MPILLSTVFAKEPAEVGVIIFPGAIFAMIVGQLIGRLIDRFGNVPIMIVGQLFLIGSTILFALLSTVSPNFILSIYMVASIGFTAISSSISNEVTRILPIDQIGSAIGTVQLTQFVGGGLGVTTGGLLLTIQEHLAAEMIYRNIYSTFAILLFFAVVLYGLYYRRAKSM